MGTVLIPDVDEAVITHLRKRALDQGTSFEAVARALLTDDARRSRMEFLAWVRENAARLPKQTSDSTAFIRAVRDGVNEMDVP